MKKIKIDPTTGKIINRWFNPFEKEEPTPTDLICPITGSILMDDGSDPHVMDSDHFYFASSDKNVKFARHPFQWNLFRLVEYRHVGERGIRYFQLNSDNTWEEYISVKGTDQLFPINTSQSEIDKYVQNEELERKERERIYDEGVANGTITPFPKFMKLEFKTIKIEDITVQPLSPPIGKISCIDFKIK